MRLPANQSEAFGVADLVLSPFPARLIEVENVLKTVSGAVLIENVGEPLKTVKHSRPPGTAGGCRTGLENNGREDIDARDG